MNWQHWIASALVGLAAVSCGENAQPGSTAAKPVALSSSSHADAPAVATVPKDGSRSTSAEADVPVPPKDAQLTILCDTIDGPGHVENARDLKAMLVKASGLTGWYVVHGEKDSTVYYGFYRSLDDPAERQRAEADRTRILALTDRVGNRMIRGGILVPLVSADPQAPAEWNLLNTPKYAYWSIEIATFAGNPKRKEAAVQAVRDLREKGETQAYYYHGPTVSSVCIGAWPRPAIKEQGTGVDRNGNPRDDSHSIDPSQPLLVFSGLPPSNLSNDVREPGTGRRMLVQAMKLEINDPDLKKKIEQYPYHYVNYELHGKTNGDQTFPDSSMLVTIPHAESAAPAAGEDDWRLGGGAGPQQPEQPARSTGGDDALKSIGK